MSKKAKKRRAVRKEAPQEDVFYVGLRDPAEVRRNVLESSREMIQFLQRYEKLKSIRDEKSAAAKQLHTDIKELRTLINKLKKVLPKTKLRIKLREEHKFETCPECGTEFKTLASLQKHVKKRHKKKAKKAKKAAPASKPKKEAKPKPTTELERLESELSDIESKLGKLS